MDSKLYLCISCDFKTCSQLLLTQHFRQMHAQEETRDETRETHETRAFHCVQSDCEYVGRNGHGLRLHLLKRHRIRVKTNECREEIVVNDNVVVVKEVVEARETNEDVFGCDLCEYKGKNYLALRTHRINKHLVRRGDQKNSDNNRKLNSRKGRNRKSVSKTVISYDKRRRARRQRERRRPTPTARDETRDEKTETTGGGEWKCQFPKCGKEFARNDTLRQHIQQHKRTLNDPLDARTCYFPECHFRCETSLELRAHLLHKHSMADPSSPTIHSNHVTGNDQMTGSGEKREFPVFRCSQPNCHFTGSLTLKGLRIHHKRNHKTPLLTKSVIKSVNNTTNNDNKPTMAATNGRARALLLFRCSHCLYAVSALPDLRAHIESAHSQQ